MPTEEKKPTALLRAHKAAAVLLLAGLVSAVDLLQVADVLRVIGVE